MGANISVLFLVGFCLYLPAHAAHDIKDCLHALQQDSTMSSAFKSVLAKKVIALKEVKEPRILMLATGSGLENALVAIHAEDQGLRNTRIDCLEIDKRANELSRWMLDDLPLVETVVRVEARDASLDSSYADLGGDYDLVVLRNPYVNDGYHNSDAFFLNSMWVQIYSQAIKRTSRQGGRLILSLYFENEFDLSLKILKHFPFADDLKIEVLYKNSNEQHVSENFIIQVSWK